VTEGKTRLDRHAPVRDLRGSIEIKIRLLARLIANHQYRMGHVPIHSFVSLEMDVDRLSMGNQRELTIGDAQVGADLSCQMIWHFIVPGNCRTTPRGTVNPPGVVPTFSKQFAAVVDQMANQIAALHG
jgi:hypothetical protein